jgi:hypothetical protein
VALYTEALVDLVETMQVEVLEEQVFLLMAQEEEEAHLVAL